MNFSIAPHSLEPATIELEINSDLNRIAVLFSGGMDSTLLLALLLKEKEERGLGTEIHCFTAPQTGRKYHSTKLLQHPFFSGKVFHHPDFYNPADEGIRPMLLQLLEEGWDVYSGANKIPPVDIGGRPPLRLYRDPLPQRLHPVFRHLYKYHILYCYNLFGWQHLVPLTSSCTENEIVPCNECFACRERNWAFSQLGVLRP